MSSSDGLVTVIGFGVIPGQVDKHESRGQRHSCRGRTAGYFIPLTPKRPLYLTMHRLLSIPRVHSTLITRNLPDHEFWNGVNVTKHERLTANMTGGKELRGAVFRVTYSRRSRLYSGPSCRCRTHGACSALK